MGVNPSTSFSVEMAATTEIRRYASAGKLDQDAMHGGVPIELLYQGKNIVPGHGLGKAQSKLFMPLLGRRLSPWT
jgi:hypothetical protein